MYSLDIESVPVLGCTGGIGSGKTYVSRIFESLGYPVYFSDDRAKMLYDTDKALLGQMVSLLGEDIITDGKLDRKIVASKIFGNKELLSKVESFVHPAVIADFKKWKKEICNSLKQQGISPDFVIFESAILLETPLVKGCADKILTVNAPYELRIERVMRRDYVTREQVEARVGKQWSDLQREALADFIIFADSKRALLPQISMVIEKMKEFGNGNR